MLPFKGPLFESKENEIEFNLLCEKLKQHPFESVWKMSFQKTNKSQEKEFIPGVYEISLPKDGFNPNKSQICHMDTEILSPRSQKMPSTMLDNSNKMSVNNIHLDKVKILQLKEMLVQKSLQDFIDLQKLYILYEIPSTDVPAFCQMLEVSSLSEVSIARFLSALLYLEKPIGLAIATALIHYMVYPKVESLKNNSAQIITYILKFSEKYPKAIIDEIIIPCLKKESLEIVQWELLFKLAKNHLPDEYVSYFLRNVLDLALPNENIFTLIHFLVEKKIKHENDLFNKLILTLQKWSPEQIRNLTFTKLLILILSTHESQITCLQLSLLNEIIKSNKTVIKKAAEIMLKKLLQAK